jgi:TonB family protein
MKTISALALCCLSCAVAANSQQAPACPTVESLRLPDGTNTKQLYEYASTVADSVSRKWNAPRENPVPWHAGVDVRISKDGQVSEAGFSTSTGNVVIDQAATDAIRQASPFAPLPSSLPADCMTVHLYFSQAPGQKLRVTTGGGVYRVGGAVSPPKAIFSPDPEYTALAEKAKLQGVCVLSLIVGPDGRPRDIRVARSLGMGLDEQAVDAVQQWRFEPAKKDGKPVAVAINVEIYFRL